MPITILADGATKSALEVAVRIMFSSFVGDATFIQLEMIREGYQMRSHLYGLNEALRIAPEGNPVLIMGITPLHLVADDPRFQGAIGHPNVVFCDSLRLAEAGSALLAIQRSPKPRNEVAIRLAHLKTTQNVMAILQHDLKYAQKDEGRKTTWMTLAATEFEDLSFDEASEKVEAWTYGGSKPFDGERLDGCFFDVEGTLIQEGKINPVIAAFIEKKSATMPVNLWTDGDIKKLAPIIRNAGIYSNIVPKSLFTGATVEEAYDDLEQSEFSSRFTITVEHYNKL